VSTLAIWVVAAAVVTIVVGKYLKYRS